MGILLLFTHPIIFALMTLVLAFFAAAWALGVFRSDREEAKAGITLLCAMRWNEYAHLISEVLKDRGLQASKTERRPGEDGFDLLFTRGNSRYLVQCTNAATQRISATSVGQLYTLTQMQGADGAIIASCAPAEPAATTLARDRRIEILADRDLWAHVKPWVAHDQRTDAEAAAHTAKRQRLLMATVVALIVAIGGYMLANAVLPQQQSAPVPAPTVITPPAPATPKHTSTADAPAALPDTNLSEEKLASRRASAVMEVRSLSRVASASWSSRSTLQVDLHDSINDIDLGDLVKNVCASLLQYEELRFTRLQIGVPTDNKEQPIQVRWRQCR